MITYVPGTTTNEASFYDGGPQQLGIEGAQEPAFEKHVYEPPGDNGWTAARGAWVRAAAAISLASCGVEEANQEMSI